MKTENRLRLRIHTAEAHRIDGRPAHAYILQAAFDHGLAGATVIRGIAGFGRAHRVHTSKVLDLSNDLPLVVEIIDIPSSIETFAASIRSVYPHGLLVIDEVAVYT